MKHRKKSLPHPYKNSITLDTVNPKDFQKHKLIFYCEQCSHFKPDDQTCTIGYSTKNHLKETNLKNFELSGRIAFCRFLEID